MDKIKYLTDGFNKFNIPYDEEKIYKLLCFMDIVLEENKKFNLTAITDEAEFIEKHLIDSALIISHITNNSIKLLDIGSGAGFPGIVVKILREDIDITLMDSLNKRVKYLNDTIKKLDLKDINAYHLRAEDAGRKEEFREKFDLVTARAVARLDMLSEFALPFVKVGGMFIPLKGSDGDEELILSRNIIGMLGGKIKSEEEIFLPYSLAKRKIYEIEKVKTTPDRFPRSMNKIKRNKIL